MKIYKMSSKANFSEINNKKILTFSEIIVFLQILNYKNNLNVNEILLNDE